MIKLSNADTSRGSHSWYNPVLIKRVDNGILSYSVISFIDGTWDKVLETPEQIVELIRQGMK